MLVVVVINFVRDKRWFLLVELCIYISIFFGGGWCVW